jgi:hypothetical protein
MGHDDGDVNEHQESESGPGKKDFVKSHGLTSGEAEELMKKFGPNALEEKHTRKWLIFVSQLYQVSVKLTLMAPMEV